MAKKIIIEEIYKACDTSQMNKNIRQILLNRIKNIQRKESLAICDE